MCILIFPLSIFLQTFSFLILNIFCDARTLRLNFFLFPAKWEKWQGKFVRLHGGARTDKTERLLSSLTKGRNGKGKIKLKIFAESWLGALSLQRFMYQFLMALELATVRLRLGFASM